jgi:hypothetical protein
MNSPDIYSLWDHQLHELSTLMNSKIGVDLNMGNGSIWMGCFISASPVPRNTTVAQTWELACEFGRYAEEISRKCEPPYFDCE